jgi:hypothetical protein
MLPKTMLSNAYGQNGRGLYFEASKVINLHGVRLKRKEQLQFSP